MKSYRKIFGAILLTIAVLSFAGILFRTHGAVKDLSVSYHVMTEADLSGDYSGALIKVWRSTGLSLTAEE